MKIFSPMNLSFAYIKYTQQVLVGLIWCWTGSHKVASLDFVPSFSREFHGMSGDSPGFPPACSDPHPGTNWLTGPGTVGKRDEIIVLLQFLLFPRGLERQVSISLELACSVSML